MKNKKLIISIICVIALILITVGVTYAYWVITRTQEKQNTISTGCLDIDIVNEENDILLSEQEPISDEKGYVLKPYTFTVTNKCDSEVDYHVALESLGDETTSVSASSIKVSIAKVSTTTLTSSLLSANVEATPTLKDAYAAHRIAVGTLAGASDETDLDEVTYRLRIWVDQNAPVEEAGRSYRSKITVTVGQGYENVAKDGTLAHDIISKYGTEDSITTLSAFPKSGSEINNLHKASDTLGTSYYLRGKVTNNYVKFGEWAETVKEIRGYDSTSKRLSKTYASLDECNAATSYNVSCEEVTIANAGDAMYWRIVRINGDGTIRLAYDGTAAYETATAHKATIGNSNYNVNSTLEKHVGYTYDVDGVETDSTIKAKLDDWYENNLKTTYGKYIADSVFCNDRQIAKVEYYDINDNLLETADGAAYLDEAFAAKIRLKKAKVPVLTCEKSDSYSVSTSIGNGLLKNPVGTITADEIYMAGGILSTSNQTYYLHSNEFAWTMTPYDYTDEGDGKATLINMGNSGYLGTTNAAFDYEVRPVISLNADVEFTGNGEQTTPYEVVMN